MSKKSRRLKLSNQGSSRGTSPRVSQALQSLAALGIIKQAGLAAKAGLNRGTLNQLWLGKTSSTPKLIGRLCAVLDRDSAMRVLEAYLEEVAADVRGEQLQVDPDKVAIPQLGSQPAALSVTYSPKVGAA